MSVLQARAVDDPAKHDVEISIAAIGGYNRLLAAVGGRIHTYGRADGSLLCESRVNRARPIIWRVTAEGEVLPDSPYNYSLRAFVTAAHPRRDVQSAHQSR